MTIAEQEEILFRKWERRHDRFARDGVIDEDSYLASNRKIVFIMKETNDCDDLREVLTDAPYWHTWNNVTRWAKGLHYLPKNLSWAEVDEISQTDRIDTLRTVAVMNIKKSPGGNKSSRSQLLMAAMADAEFLRLQFQMYDPDLAICCGDTVDESFDIFYSGGPQEWKHTKNDLYYFEFGPRKIVISFSHPQATKEKFEMYQRLIQGVNAILQ